VSDIQTKQNCAVGPRIKSHLHSSASSVRLRFFAAGLSSFAISVAPSFPRKKGFTSSSPSRVFLFDDEPAVDFGFKVGEKPAGAPWELPLPNKLEHPPPLISAII
jgi:hypothetical protein